MEDKQDEIDLIDLIAVIIRYRWFILGTLFLSILLTIGAYLILPELRKEKKDDIYTERLVTQFFYTPDVLDFSDIKTLNTYIIQSATDSELFISSLIESGISDYAGFTFSDPKNLNEQKIIRHFLSADAGSLQVIEKTDSLQISLKVTSGFDFSMFYKIFVDKINSKLINLLRTYADGKIWEFENVTLTQYPFAAVDPKLASKYNQYTAAKRFALTDVPSIQLIQDPILVKNSESTNLSDYKRSILKKGIIITVATIMLSIFFSFLFNWIDMVRNDPVSMEKLKKAMEKKRK